MSRNGVQLTLGKRSLAEPRLGIPKNRSRRFRRLRTFDGVTSISIFVNDGMTSEDSRLGCQGRQASSLSQQPERLFAKTGGTPAFRDEPIARYICVRMSVSSDGVSSVAPLMSRQNSFFVTR